MKTAGLPEESPTFSQDYRIPPGTRPQINLSEDEMRNDYLIKHGKV